MGDKYIVVGIVVVLVLICLVIVFCIQLIKLYISKIKKHNEEKLTFQKTLNQAIIETQEQVLNNISQDLHDDAGQQITYINFQLENLKLDSPEYQKMLEPLSESVSNLSESIRSISHSLNNQLLLQQDLLKAIATEVARLQKNSKVKIYFQCDEYSIKVFSSNEKIIIYRIFQEIINNIFKHARAKSVSITVDCRPAFSLIIADDGKGFDLSEASAGNHTLGLQGIRSRAESIRYALDIQSKVGKGTIIRLFENETK